MLGPSRYVASREPDGSFVHQKRSGDGIQQSGFPRAIGSDDDHPGTGCQLKVHAAQGTDFIRRARVECLRDTLNFKHGRSAGAFLAQELRHDEGAENEHVP